MSMNTAKFGLLFYADTKNAEKGMNRMSNQLGGMQASLMHMSDTMGGAFRKLSGVITGIGTSIIGTAARLETSKKKLEFAFRADEMKDTIFDRVEKAGLISIATTDDLVNSVSTLKQMTGVNVFADEVTKSLKEAGPKMTTFVELMDDMAAASPQGMNTVTRGLSYLLGGQTGRAGMLLDAIKPKMKDYEKAMKGAKTESGKLAAITGLLFKQYGGAGAAQADTWKFATAQLDDVSDKMLSTFGQPMIKALVPSIKEFTGYFTDKNGMLNNGSLDGITAIFEDIAKGIDKTVRFLGPMMKNMFEFVLLHPGIIKVGLALLGVLTAVTGIAAALIGAKLAVMALQFAFSGLLTTMLPLTLLFAGFAVGAVYLTKWIVGGKSMGDTWERVVLIFTGLYEMLTSMNGATVTLSESTHKALGEKGLMGLTVRLAKIVLKWKRLFQGIGDGFAANWGKIKAAFEPIAQRMTKWFGTNKKDVKGSTDSWHNAGVVIANVLTKLIQLVAWSTDKFMALLEVLSDIGSWMLNNKASVIAMGAAFASFRLGGAAAGALGASGQLTNIGTAAMTASRSLSALGAAVGLTLVAVKGLEAYYNSKLDKEMGRKRKIATGKATVRQFKEDPGAMAELMSQAFTGAATSRKTRQRVGMLNLSSSEGKYMDDKSGRVSALGRKKIARDYNLTALNKGMENTSKGKADRARMEELVTMFNMASAAKSKNEKNYTPKVQVTVNLDGEKIGEQNGDRGGGLPFGINLGLPFGIGE